MARKTRSTKDTTISRGAETGAPTSRESIPDPPGDDRQAGRTGEVTSGEPEFEGLLRAGATPRRDGGLEEHPMNDHGHEDDLGPEAFEEQVEEARKTGFEPQEEDEEPTDEDVETRPVRRRSTG